MVRVGVLAVGLYTIFVTKAAAVDICSQPLFAKEMEARGAIYGRDYEKAIEGAKWLNETKPKFCRRIKGRLHHDSDTHVSGNCFQYTGIYEGRRVYWGECGE
jgi:hypothetical protein